MSEVRWQLLILESAVALARATAEPTMGSSRQKGSAPALLKAAALVEAVDAAIDWADISEGWPGHFYFYGPPDALLNWLSGDGFDDSVTPLTKARERAEAAFGRFDHLGEPHPDELTAKTMLNSVFSGALAAEKVALDFHAALRELRELQTHGSPDALELAAQQVLKQGLDARLQIKALTGDRNVLRRAAIALLPDLTYGPNEDLPIVRMKQESPLEVVVILIGSAGAAVGVLNGLLDVQIKYKTRKMKERAERSRLERELAEDEAKAEAVTELRRTFSASEPERLRIQNLTVFDSLEEAVEDDEEMKAT